ncbi:hypothetical protein J1G42_12400 [Cellulomonas sp. zg-ZUI222]|uniref:Uncharacterized protein n=1 Tax=Cellulomonas wangleii TaxID=2816956 RepID=A0ABX8D7Q6_9CELL|nr:MULTISPECIES: hypothetical protein [Cellulomonas]MBO0900969.1 hypothetical protein [Cellulomonas sp. zg-ZUI22]MBO0921624.1 hypothetical protein [Cellulomonas wangleii]MBO0925120.1 hypothetical protein [Cellulomonas wangleii]QVI63471.1 hypothetical protein KG103_06275 [Cellulomonas wangleii]
MDILWIVVIALTAAAWVAWLVHVVRHDGLGDHEPPRSHPHEVHQPVTQIFLR